MNAVVPKQCMRDRSARSHADSERRRHLQLHVRDYVALGDTGRLHLWLGARVVGPRRASNDSLALCCQSLLRTRRTRLVCGLCPIIRGGSRSRSIFVLLSRLSHTTWRSVVWRLSLAHCEVTKLSIVVELILVIEISKLLEVELVAQNSADTTEAAHKLIALGRTIRNEL